MPSSSFPILRTRSLTLLGLALATAALSPACGGGGGSGKPTPSPATNVVVVTDGFSGAPRAGIDVVVSDSSGSPVSHLVTGSDGRAGVTVPAGGTVSVYAETYIAVTNGPVEYDGQGIVDPPTGEELPFAVAPAVFPTPTAPVTTYDVTLTGITPPSFVRVLGPCFQSYTDTTTSTATLESPCSSGGTILAVVYSNGDYALFGSKTVTSAPGTSVPVTIALSAGSLDLAAFHAVNLAFPSPPVGSTESSLIDLASADFNFIPSISGGTDQTSVQGTLDFPAGVTTAGIVSFLNELCPSSGVCYDDVSIQQTIPLPFTGTVQLDAGVPIPVLDPLDRSIPDRPVFRWLPSAVSPEAPCAREELQWDTFSGDSGSYRLVSPGSQPFARVPGVPPELQPFGVGSEDALLEEQVSLQYSPQFSGYGDCVAQVPATSETTATSAELLTPP